MWFLGHSTDFDTDWHTLGTRWHTAQLFCIIIMQKPLQTRQTFELFSPKVSLSGNYDLNGQRSASPCWPSVVAQQRLNRPRLKVCDFWLFTILSLAHALAYAAYTAKYHLHLRLVRTGLPLAVLYNVSNHGVHHCILTRQTDTAQFCGAHLHSDSAFGYQNLIILVITAFFGKHAFNVHFFILNIHFRISHIHFFFIQKSTYM